MAGEVQAQLGAGEALVLFLDTQEWKAAPEETFIWVVTKTEVRWLRSNLGTESVTHLVATLRCGLDGEAWSTPSRRKRCAALLGLKAVPDSSKILALRS